MRKYTEINQWLDEHDKNENYQKGHEIVSKMWKDMLEFSELFGVEVSIIVVEPSDVIVE